MKYPEFKNIIETMKEHRYDFEADIKRVQNTAKTAKNFRYQSILNGWFLLSFPITDRGRSLKITEVILKKYSIILTLNF